MSAVLMLRAEWGRAIDRLLEAGSSDDAIELRARAIAARRAYALAVVGLSGRQADVAAALAAAFNHAWASQPCDHEGWEGIQGPTVDASGVVRHTTGSGSLTWAVTRDGSVEIGSRVAPELEVDIWRAAGNAIVASGYVPEDVATSDLRRDAAGYPLPRGPMGERNEALDRVRWALRCAVTALAGQSEFERLVRLSA